VNPIELHEISTKVDAEYSGRTMIVAPLQSVATDKWQEHFEEVAAADYLGLPQKAGDLLIYDNCIWVTVPHEGVTKAIADLRACVEQTNSDLANQAP